MELMFMIIITLAAAYGVYRYSKWLRRDRPHPGGGGIPNEDLPTYDPDKDK
jgi:hypothetical protein